MPVATGRFGGVDRYGRRHRVKRRGVLRQSSQHELHQHVPSGVVGNSMGLEEEPSTPREEQFCGTLEPGDALIHHCQTMHRSDPNKSALLGTPLLAATVLACREFEHSRWVGHLLANVKEDVREDA